MKVDIESFYLQKDGNSVEEYEDAFWPHDSELHGSSIRIAVADGASETSFANLWAKLIVEDYGNGVLRIDNFADRLNLLRDHWNHKVKTEELKWYGEEKLAEGAFSSLLGLTLHELDRTWNSIAIGDSCLFHIREKKRIRSCPLDDPESFHNRPVLLSSIKFDAESIENEMIESPNGNWEPGDEFYLMTDALACWFLRYRDSSSSNDGYLYNDGSDSSELLHPIGWIEDALSMIDNIKCQGDFEQFVKEQRMIISESGAPNLKNDDVTLLICRVHIGIERSGES